MSPNFHACVYTQVFANLCGCCVHLVAVLLLALLTPNLCSPLPLVYYYLVYAFALVVVISIVCFTAGAVTDACPSLVTCCSNASFACANSLHNIGMARGSSFGFVAASGAVFLIGNVLIVVSFEVAGLAVALPICLGIAMSAGTLLTYLVQVCIVVCCSPVCDTDHCV